MVFEGLEVWVRVEVVILGKDDRFLRKIHFWLTSVSSSLCVLLKITLSAAKFSLLFFLPLSGSAK